MQASPLDQGLDKCRPFGVACWGALGSIDNNKTVLFCLGWRVRERSILCSGHCVVSVAVRMQHGDMCWVPQGLRGARKILVTWHQSGFFEALHGQYQVQCFSRTLPCCSELSLPPCSLSPNTD
jgi:hypothetical protein